MRFDRLHQLLILLFAAFLLRVEGSKSWGIPTNGRYAQGNLAVVFEPRSGRSSEHSPILTNLSSLWCQATENGEDRLRIKHARFVRVYPAPPTIHEAQISPDLTRASLSFGVVAAPQTIGKYRCEITTDSNNHVSGNMFVYMRPILHLSSASPRVELIDDKNPYAFLGSSTHSIENDTVSMNCPVIGFPIPEIIWLKDGKMINKSAVIEIPNSAYGPFKKYIISASGIKLQINQATEEDEGTYRCVAKNHFQLSVEGKMVDFELSLDQFLRISRSLAWTIPLLVIVLMLVLLALTIYLCSLWGRYKSNEYNVAQKEKEMGRLDSEKLNNGADEA